MTLRAGVIGASMAGLAVLAGAFAAHGLRAQLPEEALAVWRTAVDYQFWHALGLLLVSVSPCANARSGQIAAGAFLVGLVLFCGSLYALALGAPRGIGLLTPFGGTAFVVGWASLALGLWRAQRR